MACSLLLEPLAVTGGQEHGRTIPLPEVEIPNLLCPSWDTFVPHEFESGGFLFTS